MLIRENYTSKKDLKRRLSQIRKAHSSNIISVKNVVHVDRLGQRSKSKQYKIVGVVKGEYREFNGDEINGFIEYYSSQKDVIPPRESELAKDDVAKIKKF